MRAEPSPSSRAFTQLPQEEIVVVLKKTPDGRWFHVKTSSGVLGWVSQRFSTPLKNETLFLITDPAWLKLAIQEIGVKECEGDCDNPRIVEYHNTTMLGPVLSSQDETPWCSSFVNWCFEKAGFEGTDSAAARSWLNWGIETTDPRRGCVVIFSRPEAGPTSGHVGFSLRSPELTSRFWAAISMTRLTFLAIQKPECWVTGGQTDTKLMS